MKKNNNKFINIETHRLLRREPSSSRDKSGDLCFHRLPLLRPSCPVSPPSDHPLHRLRLNYLPHGVVVTAAELGAGRSVYVEIAETMFVVSEDQVNYLGVIDSNRPDCRHCSRVAADDAEERPAVAHDFALKTVTEAWT